MRSFWWQSLTGRARSTRAGGRKTCFDRFLRPGVEYLEDRTLLAAVHPLYQLLDPSPGVSPLATSSPNGYTPAQVKAGYGVNLIQFAGGVVGDGAGQTIAIVDAYDDPNIQADLNAFSTAFGLPTTSSGLFTFSKVNEDGGTSLPAPGPSWAIETSLDVEWAHAIAPRANILLVEAFSPTNADIFTAIDYAASQPGVSVVSMSFGESEESTETSLDGQYFVTPAGHNGVSFVASSGDEGAPPEYPSASPNVLGVGGTSLNLDSSGDYLGETGWSGSGGGISAYESQPAYQQGIVTQSSTQRTTPDVAFDANPGTGFPEYNSFTYGSSTPWQEVGGTSCGAPQWSALIAIADEGRVLAGEGTLDGPSQLLPMIYSMAAADFHDITSGSSDGNPSYSAGPGYDLVTGLGTPVANLVVASLVGSVAITPTSTSTSLTSSVNPSIVGESVTFTAQVSASGGTPTGTVSFMDGTTTLESETLSNGSASFTTAALTTGDYSITAVYAGTSSFAASTSAALTQVVDQSPDTVGLSSSLNHAAFGQSVTFTAVVAGIEPGAPTPTGTVTFMNGSTTLGMGTLSGGDATFSTAGLPVGTASITAIYSGDSNFSSTTSTPLLETVDKAAATIVDSSSANPSLYGQTVTFTADVTGSGGTPTGTVVFMNGTSTLATKTLSGGLASFTDAAFAVGSYSLTVVYSGDGSFVGGTSSELTQTVNKASTTNQLTVSPSPATVGQTLTLTSTMAAVAPAGGIPAGTITFRDGSVMIGQVRLADGVATLQTTALPVGTDSLTAVWGGDGNNIGSTSSPVLEVVDPAPETPSSTALSSSANPSVFGQSVTFTAQVTGSGGTPTGTVTFLNGSSTLGTGTLTNGSTTFTTATLTPDSYNITAVYSGDTTFDSSTSTALTQAVDLSGSAVALTSSLNPSTAGQSVTFNVAVTAVAPGSGTPTGAVTFLNGTSTLGSAILSGGSASYSTAALPVGSDSITASYSGDGNFASTVSLALTQIVNQPSEGATATLLSSNVNPSVYSQPVTFTAQVTASGGTPTGTVAFMNGTAVLATETLSGGTASYTNNSLAAGSYTITAVYSGGTTFTGSTSAPMTQTVNKASTTDQLTVSPSPATVAQTVTLTATLAAVAPAVATPGGTVTFRNGSVTIGQARLVDGVATFQTTTLAVGTYDLIAVWGGDADNIGSTSTTVVETINPASGVVVNANFKGAAATTRPDSLLLAALAAFGSGRSLSVTSLRTETDSGLIPSLVQAAWSSENEATADLSSHLPDIRGTQGDATGIALRTFSNFLDDALLGDWVADLLRGKDEA
jgi:hypothetical protein